MKLTCDEATTICDKNQYGEASLWNKIKLTIHLILCPNCGKYSKQNGFMTKCYNEHKRCNSEDSTCLCEEEKSQMEQKIKSEI